MQGCSRQQPHVVGLAAESKIRIQPSGHGRRASGQMLGRHDEVRGGTPRQVLNTPRKMLKLAPYRYVCHLTGLRKLIDGNNEFTAGLRLVKKLLREPRPSWLRVPAMTDSCSGDGGHHRSEATQAGGLLYRLSVMVPRGIGLAHRLG